jgi:two-component system chemotaxis response regulator CheY
MVTTVLSIDDDKVTQILNGIHLKNNKFCTTIIEAYNGKEAIDFFKKLDSGEISMESFPEVIFLDLNMPIMDGWDFLEIFKREFAQFEEKTKIFIISSSINPADVERANNEKSIVAFLAKPLNSENLKKVINLLGLKENI